MRDAYCGAVPIGENARLIGMVTDRDIVCRGCADGRDPTAMTARDVMTSGIVYCTEDQSIEDAIHMMEEKQIRRMPVIDGKKRMRSEEHTSELQSLMRISYAVFCLKKKKKQHNVQN